MTEFAITVAEGCAARQMFFIDAGVADAASIVDALPPRAEIAWIDASRDGLCQFAEWAHGKSGYDAIHIISHGQPGALRLGNMLLDFAAVQERRDALEVLGNALTADGDILLYGCEAAFGEQGRAYIAAWAEATGADVAASATPTGMAALGGDWMLESRVGAVEAQPLSIPGYAGLLANGTLTFTSDDPTDWADGIAEDGEGGSTDLSGITFQIYNISDASGTKIDVPIEWKDDDELSTGGAVVTGLTTFDPDLTLNGWAGFEIKSADGAEFQLNGFEWYDWGWAGSNVAVVGYRNGIQVALANFTANDDGTSRSPTFDATFDYVDEVRITYSSGAGWGAINNIQIADGIVPFASPTATATGVSPSVIENGAAVDLFSSVSTATNDSGQTFVGMTMTVTNVSNGASETMSIGGTSVALTNGNSGTISGIGSYSVSVSSGIATITLSGMTRSDGQMASLIDGMTYVNGSNDPGSASRVVTITGLTDSGGSNNTVSTNISSTISMTPVNDAPTLSATGSTPTYTENGSAVDLFSGVTASTVESGQTLKGLGLTVSHVTDDASEILHIDGSDIALTNGNSVTTASNGMTVSVTVVGSTATVTVTKAAGLSTSAYATLVDGISYRNSSDTPTEADRVVTLTSIQDNGSTSSGGIDTATLSISATVSVVAVNDAPVVVTSGGTAAAAEGVPHVIDSGLTLSDADSSTLTSATVSITGNHHSAEDVLAFTNDSATMGNISASFDSATGVMTLTSSGATASLAQWQSALRSVTYNDSSDAPNTGNRTISFSVNDGETDSSVATRVVSVSAVNDAPVVSVPASIAVTEDTSTAVTGISFSDVDAGSSSVTVTLSIGSGSLAATSGGGVTIGGSATAMTLTGTIAAINSYIAASHVAFTTSSNATGDVVLTASIDDGGNTGSGGARTDSQTVTLEVTAVNDVPTISAPGPIAVTEDVSTALSGISFADIDAGSGHVTATLSVGSGTLAAASGSGVVVVGAGTGSVTLTGSIADINAFIANSGVSFTTASNATSNVTLTATVDDGGSSGSGGSQTASTTVTLAVSAVNDAPVNTVPGTQSLVQDASITFSTGNGNLISVSDVDAGSNTVRVTLTVTHGALTLSGTTGLSFVAGSGAGDLTMTFEGTLADINTALNGMVYEPAGGYHGPASLQITSSDLGNAGSGGTQTDTDTISLSIAQSNPAISDVSVSNADGSYHVNEVITVTVSFDQAIFVDTTHGIPTLLLETGTTDRSISYVSGSGSNTLTFSYVVQAGDQSADLDFASTAALALNGATIKNVGGDDAVLTLPMVGGSHSIAGQHAIVIDGIAPTISSVDVPTNGVYEGGQNLDFTVNVSEAVTIDTTGGIPRIAITLDTGGTVYASYISGSGGSALVFRLTVQDSQMDMDGVSVGTTIDLNGGTIRDTAGNNAVTTLNNIGATTDVHIANDAPVLTGDLTATVLEGGTYALTTADLNFSDPDDTAPGVTFTISSLSHGTVKVNGTAAMSFTGAQLAAGLVTFMHDGSETSAASFKVAVEDGNEDSSAPVQLTFNFDVDGVNDAPNLTLTQKFMSIAEDASTAHARKVADIDVSDADGGSNNLSLAGADASLFEIRNGDLWLKAGAKLDFETNPKLNVTVRLDDPTIGSTYEDSRSIKILVKDVVERTHGGTGDDKLIGGKYDDLLDGKGGDDVIKGGGGDDKLIGGKGVDTMTGGAGHDTFIFVSIKDSAPGISGFVNNGSFDPLSGAGKRDIVTDFGDGDILSFKAIDANTLLAGDQAFVWRGQGDFTGKAGELTYRIFDHAGTAKDMTIIYGDTNLDGRADFQVELTGIIHLTKGDFLL